MQNRKDRPGRKREDNIKMDFKQAGRDDMNWIHLANDRDKWKGVKNTAMELLVKKKPMRISLLTEKL